LNVLHGARLFLGHVQKVRLIAVAAVEHTAHDPALLMAFREWMRQQRGTCEGILDNYAIHIRELLKASERSRKDLMH
jgi:predicted protein tyrosine phosphatase